MHATRALLSQSSLRGFIIPPRSTWDVVSSAGKACVSLFTDQKERDNFVNTLNKGIINPPVLGQANMGVAMMLALYNDLNSPLFKKYSFSVEDFTPGAKPALEHFHEVLISAQEDAVKEDDENGEGAEKDADKPEAPGAEKAEEEEDSDAEAKDDAAKVAALLKTFGSTDDSVVFGQEAGDWDRIFSVVKKNWSSIAEEDPESTMAQLKMMVTPEYFHVIEQSSKANFMAERRFKYTAESGPITNMALLSARVMEVTPQKDESESEIETDKPMQDDSLSEKKEEDPAVVAQVEVLYDIQHTYTAKEGGVEIGSMKLTEGEPSETTQVLVGVFQGWLHGDPDGNESIRWKLAMNRPAWEFPYLMNA